MNRFGTGPVLLVGAGRMGSALLKGWVAQGLEADRVFVQEPSMTAEMAAFCRQHGITVAARPVMPQPPAVILLAVKPQLMDAVLPDVTPQTGPDTVVLSVAAGRTIASIATHFQAGTAIVRTMPNTPAAIGRGISALFGNDAVKPEQAQLCETLMAAAGEIVWLDSETQMDAVTAVSGSGPAYIFLLAECLAEAGEKAGLPPDMAAKLARATVSGAGELLRQSDLSAGELRRNVTSPGGTTEAAISVLMGQIDGSPANSLSALMTEAVKAAARRSKELAL